MTKYKLTVICPTNKVAQIKMLRDLVGIGLRDAKDYVEKHWEDKWTSNWPDCQIHLVVNESCLGYLFVKDWQRERQRIGPRQWSVDKLEVLDPINDLTELS